MRTAATLFLATMITVSAAGGVAAHRHKYWCCDSDRHTWCNRSGCCFDGISVDFDDGTLCLRQTGGKGKVEITEEYELSVNGRDVSTTSAQKALLKDYYNGATQVVEYAEKLGREGAKVGVAGAALGLSAVGGVAKVLFTGYDSDDFERDMEREAERLESRAAKLEDVADDLEDLADELDEVRHEMRRQIPELRKLSWF